MIRNLGVVSLMLSTLACLSATGQSIDSLSPIPAPLLRLGVGDSVRFLVTAEGRLFSWLGTVPNKKPAPFEPPTEVSGEDWALALDDAAENYSEPGTRSPLSSHEGPTRTGSSKEVAVVIANSPQFADKAGNPGPPQFQGIGPKEGAPAIAMDGPPSLIPNPSATETHSRANRTCTGVPSIAITRGGRFWVAWYSGTTPGAKIESCPNAYVVVSTSADGGTTWKEVLAIDPDGPGPLKAVDPRPWVDPEGGLWIIWHMTISGWSYTYQFKKAWAITAGDGENENPSWSQPRHIADGVMLNKPVVLSNGDWLFTAHDRKTLDVSLLKAVVSDDKGRTFNIRGAIEVSQDLHAIEPMTVERKDGSLWMLIRTGHAGHPESAQGIYESVSTDRGATWGPLKPSAIKHTASRFYIGRLQSGNLLLVKHSGIDVDPASQGKKQRRELTAFISQDDGRSWSSGLVVDERIGCTYPDAQQTADGTIYLTWDFQRSSEQEILLTTFREEDVLAGSAEAMARVKTNRRLVSKGGVE